MVCTAHPVYITINIHWQPMAQVPTAVIAKLPQQFSFFMLSSICYPRYNIDISDPIKCVCIPAPNLCAFDESHGLK